MRTAADPQQSSYAQEAERFGNPPQAPYPQQPVSAAPVIVQQGGGGFGGGMGGLLTGVLLGEALNSGRERVVERDVIVDDESRRRGNDGGNGGARLRPGLERLERRQRWRRNRYGQQRRFGRLDGYLIHAVIRNPPSNDKQAPRNGACFFMRACRPAASYARKPTSSCRPRAAGLMLRKQHRTRKQPDDKTLRVRDQRIAASRHPRRCIQPIDGTVAARSACRLRRRCRVRASALAPVARRHPPFPPTPRADSRALRHAAPATCRDTRPAHSETPRGSPA